MSICSVPSISGARKQKTQHMLAFVFLSSCLQLPNHVFRLVVLQRWHLSLLPQIFLNLLHCCLLVAEILLGCVHLRTMLLRIYQLNLD